LWLPESTPRIDEDREALAMLVIDQSLADRPNLQVHISRLAETPPRARHHDRQHLAREGAEPQQRGLDRER
jgi:hypothetical protein